MVRARVLARFALTLVVVLSLSVSLAWSADQAPTKGAMHKKTTNVKQTTNMTPAEKTITQDQVPAPVMQAFTKAYPDATPKTFTQKTTNGHVRYDIAHTDKMGNSTRHAVYTSAGKMIETDETITSADLPQAVQTTISTQYPSDKILYSQRITRDNATDYGVVVSGDKHMTHVILDAKGTVIKTEAESQIGIPATEMAPQAAAPATTSKAPTKP